jgi:hypothetical protein
MAARARLLLKRARTELALHAAHQPGVGVKGAAPKACSKTERRGQVGTGLNWIDYNKRMPSITRVMLW